MELKLIGEGNDYVAKGLSGGRVIIVPPKDAAYDVENSPIVGNVVCFGANRGKAISAGRLANVSVFEIVVPTWWLKESVIMAVNI